MKTRLFLIVAIVAVLSLATMAFAPFRMLQQDEGGLSEWQVFVVGLVASALLWVLKLIVSQGYQPSKEVVAIALYVVSFGMALLFKAFAFPAFPACTDAPTCVNAALLYVGQLLEQVAPIVGMAYLIYNIFLQRVLEAALYSVRARIAADR